MRESVRLGVVALVLALGGALSAAEAPPAPGPAPARPATTQPLHDLSDHPALINSLCYSPDGQALASNFRAAVRDRSGTDVFSGVADFSIGKLEVR